MLELQKFQGSQVPSSKFSDIEGGLLAEPTAIEPLGTLGSTHQNPQIAFGMGLKQF